MDNLTSQNKLPSTEYVPPKDWEEITLDEKIERMRQIVKSLSSSLGQAQTQIHNLRMKLKRHSHQDGKVYEVKEVQDYDDSIGGLLGSATPSDNKYF